MAKRTYYCKECDLSFQKLVDNVVDIIRCGGCDSEMELKIGIVSTVVKEVIDNGFQVRRVEQIANAPELFQERADNANKKKNTDEL